MNISVGSYRFRLEIVLLIAFISFVMFGHLICSCANVSATDAISQVKEGCKIIANNASKKYKKEGFAANNFAEGPQFAMSGSSGTIRNPNTWASPTLTYSSASQADAGVKKIMDRAAQPIPLPKNELDMFATTPFKPECCPNTYSNSMGCACMTTKQYDYLVDRGGNNVPYSEY
jgi:hypothetical protein